MKKFTAFLLISAVTVLSLSAQTNQFPPGMDWKKIEADNFTLIFPADMTDTAMETAQLFDYIYDTDAYSLKTATDRWQVVLNNTYTISNGYVASAPEHSMLYNLPPQGSTLSGTSDWLEFVWIHELRHIVQNEKLNRGFTAFAAFLFGEYGSAAMSHFAVPSWVWEGDAVITETLLTDSGRGRLPGFERGLRTQVLSGETPDYSQAMLGSTGSYFPNYYVNGYHLAAYIRDKYGIEKFNRILETAADFSFVPTILNLSVKKYTGKSVNTLWKACLSDLEEKWTEQKSFYQISPMQEVYRPENDSYQNIYPVGTGAAGEVYTYNTSYSRRPWLGVIGADGKNTRLKTINPADRNISFQNGVFCWTEVTGDLRWGNLSYDEIRRYEPATGEYRLITDKTRYFSPSLSPDAQRVAAVEILEDCTENLVIIDSDSGELINKYNLPDGSSNFQTCWSTDGRSVILLRQQNWRKSIVQIYSETGKSRILLKDADYDISGPAASKDYLYFISTAAGIEEVHAVDLVTGELHRAAGSSFGLSNPVPAANGLIAADYTIGGYRPVMLDSAEMELLPASGIENHHVDYFTGLVEQENGIKYPDNLDEAKTQDRDYTVRDYSPFPGAFNFHSRGVTTSEFSGAVLAYMQADDILGYTSNMIGAGYNPDSIELAASISGWYGGLWPVLVYGIETGTPAVSPGSYFNTIAYTGVMLPFNFSSGNILRSLYTQTTLLANINDSSSINFQTVLQNNLSLSVYEYQAVKDLIPRTGFTLDATWYLSLDPAYYNYIFSRLETYLPSFLENHGIMAGIEAGLNPGSERYNLASWTAPRAMTASDYGYTAMYTATLDYMFPLAYPDFSLGSLFYLQRIWTDIFLDTSFCYNSMIPASFTPDELLQTTGIELWFNYNILFTEVELSSGIRFAYNTQNGVFTLQDTVLLLGFSW